MRSRRTRRSAWTRPSPRSPSSASTRATQEAVLDATIEQWSGPAQEAGGLGAIVPADWDASIAYLTTLGLVPNPVTADEMLDTTLLPARD